MCQKNCLRRYYILLQKEIDRKSPSVLAIRRATPLYDKMFSEWYKKPSIHNLTRSEIEGWGCIPPAAGTVQVVPFHAPPDFFLR